MAETDGRVYIDTEIQTDGFEKGTKEMGSASKKMAESVKKIGTAMNGYSKEAMNFIENYASGMVKSQGATNEFLKELEAARTAVEELEGQGKWFGDEEYDNAILKLEQIERAAKDYKKELLSPSNSANPFGLDTLSGKIVDAELKLQKLIESGKGLGDADYDKTYRELALMKEEAKAYSKELSKTPEQIKKEEEALAKAKAKEEAKINSILQKQEELRSKEVAAAVESQRLKEIGNNADVSRQDIVNLTNELTQLKARQRELQQAGVGLGFEEFDRNSARISQINKRLAEYKNALMSASMEEKKTTATGGRLKAAIVKLGNSVKNTGKKLSGMKKETKKSGASMKKMLATSLLMGIAFRAFSAAVQGVQEGVNNLAQYSSETNNNLSALKSSLTQLKNSLATAFALILSVVTPILTGFINMLSKAISYAGMFFAALTGKTSFTKAVAVQEDYAASLGDTASGAEEAKDAMEGYLSPLDEINKMDSQESSSNSGSSGTGTVPVKDMFETEEIDSSISNLANTFKGKLQPILGKFKDFGIRIKESTSEWFEDLNWQPLMDSIDSLLAAAEPLISVILDGLAWAYENILLPFGKWTIEEALPVALETLAKVFQTITAVINALAPVFMYLWKNILEPFGQCIGDVVIAALEGLGGVADFLTGVFTGDWELAFSGIEAILGSLKDQANAIFGFIRERIMEPFDKFLQGIFAKDWTVQFGVLGEGANVFFRLVKDIWTGIKSGFSGITTFINGVFTGDWKKALSGIKEIFKGTFESLVGIVKLPINGIIGMLNGLITGIVAGINTVIKGINKIKFDVPDWVPKIGGKSVGFDLKQMTAPKIPYLATGAVIPPNAPFTAVLGDQKQGTNIETPEKLLRQIMREELGGKKQTSGGTFKFIGQINRRVLFEELITEAKLRQSQNGRNPFELA